MAALLIGVVVAAPLACFALLGVFWWRLTRSW